MHPTVHVHPAIEKLSNCDTKNKCKHSHGTLPCETEVAARQCSEKTQESKTLISLNKKFATDNFEKIKKVSVENIGETLLKTNNFSSGHSPVDVSANEHFVVESMVHGDFESAAKNIAALDDKNRTEPFRGRTEDDIKKILVQLDDKIRSITRHDEIFVSPIGNQSQQDLYATKTGKNIELKTGYFITDAAIGRATAELLVPENIMKNLPTTSDHEKRMDLYKKGKKTESKQLFEQTIKNLVKETNKSQVGEEQQKALNLFVTGITREKELKKHLQDAQKEKPGYYLVKLKKNNKEKELPEWQISKTRAYDPDRKWSIQAVPNDKNRLNILFTRDDGLLVKMTYHQKNSKRITMPNGVVEKTGYEYGFGANCFNVWMSDPSVKE